MSLTFWIIIGLVVVGFLVWKLMIPSLSGEISKAKEQQEITPIINVIDKLKPSLQPTAFNHAIQKLWENYERRLAIKLVIVLVERYSSSLIAQYWLKQVLQVEPQLAQEEISKEFVTEHYNPELASQCGRVG